MNARLVLSQTRSSISPIAKLLSVTDCYGDLASSIHRLRDATGSHKKGRDGAIAALMALSLASQTTVADRNWFITSKSRHSPNPKSLKMYHRTHLFSRQVTCCILVLVVSLRVTLSVPPSTMSQDTFIRKTQKKERLRW